MHSTSKLANGLHTSEPPGEILKACPGELLRDCHCKKPMHSTSKLANGLHISAPPGEILTVCRGASLLYKVRPEKSRTKVAPVLFPKCILTTCTRKVFDRLFRLKLFYILLPFLGNHKMQISIISK
jgi:hypothetical protein